MKKAFEILRDRPIISVALTRDSVCAADDCFAPHQRTAKINSFVDPETMAQESSSGYLPTVAGVGHSWICVFNNIEIAEIKTTGIMALVREVSFTEENRIHFIYKSATY
jgi:hypothetical protein